MNSNNISAQPIQADSRIQSLDILRGFAILGILIMNIQSFSMPGAAYLNPMAYGDMTGINKWVWIISHVLGDQKFMTIFSILFGAGVVLFCQRAEDKTGRSAGLHYRRTFWLLVFGLIHAHFIWYGDILVPYALCALLVYLLRKMNPTPLMIIGIIMISVHTILYLFLGFSLEMWPEESIAETMKSWKPSEEAIAAKVAAYSGDWSAAQAFRTESALFLETFVFLTTFLWRAGGLMLIGMAMFKKGWLSAQKSNTFYLRGWIISWAIGLPLASYGVYKNFAADWAMEYSMFIGSQYNYWASLFISFGFICMIMLLAKSYSFVEIRKRLAAVGRMALTNYLLQSLIAVLIFYGSGFGYYGSVDRWGQILIMFGIWTLQLWYSKPWLEKYNFGPFEWLWRSLTYWKMQKMRK